MRSQTVIAIGTGKKTVMRAMAQEVLDRVAERLKCRMDYSADSPLILDAGGGGKAGGSVDRFLVQMNHPA